MIYSSVSFFFFFLFIVLVYLFISDKLKTMWLLISSLLWISSWNPLWACIFTFIALFNYVYLSIFKNSSGKKRRISFAVLLTTDVVFFVVLKVGTFLSYQFETPYGISFFMFILFGYIVDLWRTESKHSITKFPSFMLMPLFFPVLVGGPVLRGKDFLPQLEKKSEFFFQNLINGLLIFAYGFLKIYFISEQLSHFNKYLFVLVKQGQLNLLIPLGLTGTLQAYVDFSSYCDMGRGVAKCFGIDIQANFRAFYYSKNPNDFWQRWNISLGTWIRDYVSFPLMLRWGRKINQNIILLFSFLIVGLWHGITLNWLLFGIFNGSIIVFFNFVNKKKRIPGIGYILVFLIFVGNGLLQRTELVSDFKFWSIIPMHSPVPGWSLLQSIGWKLAIALIILFLTEYKQEKTQNVDWFTKEHIYLKVFTVLAFIIWLFYGLNSQMFIEDVILPPVYFRI